jgi:hypothetical protein
MIQRFDGGAKRPATISRMFDDFTELGAGVDERMLLRRHDTTHTRITDI